MTKISILTGKESRAFIVRRIVLGCLSPDGGARGEVRRIMLREKRRAQGGTRGGRTGRTGGGREGEEGGGEEGRERRVRVENKDRRVLEDNRQAGYDLHRVERHQTKSSHSLLVNFLSIESFQAILPLNAPPIFSLSTHFCDTKKVVLAGFSLPVETSCVNRMTAITQS